MPSFVQPRNAVVFIEELIAMADGLALTFSLAGMEGFGADALRQIIIFTAKSLADIESPFQGEHALADLSQVGVILIDIDAAGGSKHFAVKLRPAPAAGEGADNAAFVGGSAVLIKDNDIRVPLVKAVGGVREGGAEDILGGVSVAVAGADAGGGIVIALRFGAAGLIGGELHAFNVDGIDIRPLIQFGGDTLRALGKKVADTLA